MSVSEGAGGTGRVITFYSYKGGTGRTMALANVAWLLASNGYRVLTIDWDLESPGLHRYFHPFLRDKELRSSDGILDLVRRYADATLRPASSSQGVKEMARIQEYAASLNWDFPQGGLIDFVPAGRQDNAYAEKVSTFDWDSFWTRLHGGQLIDALRDDMARHYDFVLIDSRTGTSDTAGICTIRMPDTVVNCFTLNKQSIDGAVAITNSIRQRTTRPTTVYPLPTRIEDGEKAKLERGRTYSRRRFASFLDFLDGEDPNAYWNAVEVPYIPYYAYEEILAVFGDRPEQNGRLLGRYERLASRIVGHECPAPVIAESDRARVLGTFEQSAPRERRNVVVAYAPLDRIWAEWLRDRLNGSGQQVSLHCIRTPLSGVDAADRLIAVYSRDFVRREEGGRLLRLSAERIASGEDSFAAVLRVDATVVEQRVPSHALVDVVGVQENRALDMLVGTLGLDPHGPAPDGRTPAVRYPAVVSPHWNIKLARNPRFSGRGGVLEEIRDRLLTNGPDGSRLALTGLPGVGKTQTALEYVYRFAAGYEVVWWVSVTQPARVRVALADLATELKLPGGDVEEQVAAVLEALRRGMPERRWLVVFDNADVPADFDELLPTGPGHVLVTSRNPQWTAHLPTLDINVFKRGESRELLGRRVEGIAQDDADRLATRLGHLPLALEQAGGWLASTGMMVGDYLDLIAGGAVQVMLENSPPDYTETITSTVQVAYDGLAERSPAASRLLELFAFMAPETIPYRVVSNRRLTELLVPYDARMHDPARHGVLIREIGRYGLARVDSATRGVVVHRLTQDIVRARFTPEQQRERQAEIAGVLAESERGNPDNSDNWDVYEALRPHLEPAGALRSEAPEVRQLVIDMARYLWQRGDYPSSEELARAALREWVARSGDDDTWVLRLRHPLALALRDQGREDEAYELNRDSYQRLRRTLGDDDQYTLITAGSYAADLRARGDYHEARELDEKTAKGMRSLLGTDDPLTLKAINNLATALRFVGEFPEAARLDRDTLERRRKTLGGNHGESISSIENLGVDLREMGDLTASFNTLETAFETARRKYGDAYWRTVQAGNSYVVTLRRMGRVARAAEIIDDLGRRAETVFGRRHRITLSCRLEQACVRWAEGRHDQARSAAEEVYADYRELRGRHHPNTMVAGNDLAIFRRCAGDLEGSLRLAEKGAERLEDVFGPRHPYTLAGMVTLANAQYASGARAAARQQDNAAYGRLRKVLSDQHPSVLAAAVNYAVSHRTEDADVAEKMREEALHALEATLGDAHPHTAAAREWRRIDVDTAPFPI